MKIKYPQYQKAVMLPALDTKADAEEADAEEAEIGMNPMPRHEIVVLDVYDVLQAFQVNNPAVQHAVKKLLRAGKDHNSTLTDLREANDSIKRAIQLVESNTVLQSSLDALSGPKSQGPQTSLPLSNTGGSMILHVSPAQDAPIMLPQSPSQTSEVHRPITILQRDQ